MIGLKENVRLLNSAGEHIGLAQAIVVENRRSMELGSWALMKNPTYKAVMVWELDWALVSRLAIIWLAKPVARKSAWQ